MKKPTKKVVVYTKEQQICDELQHGLNGFMVDRAGDLKAINEAAKKEETSVVVLHIRDSSDWMAFEMMKTGYPNLPCFIIVEENTNGDMPEDTEQPHAMAVFTKNKTKSLAALIHSSINNTLRETAPPDKNADLLKTLAEISREISRLREEFTVTSFRTLPQTLIGKDTQKRLSQTLLKIKAIRIEP